MGRPAFLIDTFMKVNMPDTRPSNTDSMQRTLMKILSVLRGGSQAPQATGISLTGSTDLGTGQGTVSSVSAGVLVAARTGRRLVHVRNHDTSIAIYVGPSGVTTSTGFLVPAGEFVILETEAAVYAIAASGSPTASYAEQYDT